MAASRSPDAPTTSAHRERETPMEPPRSPHEVLERIAAAVNGHDLEAFLALHEPDAVVVPPGGVKTRGVEAMREVLTPLFQGRPSTEIDLHGFLETGDLAMSHS